MKRRSYRAWAIFGFRGHLIVPSVRGTRREAIRWSVENVNQPWPKLRAQGLRVRRVRVTPEKGR